MESPCSSPPWDLQVSLEKQVEVAVILTIVRLMTPRLQVCPYQRKILVVQTLWQLEAVSMLV